MTFFSLGSIRCKDGRHNFLPLAHRHARVIGTDALRILVISQEASGGEEGNQDNEDNPNIDAHQSRLLPPVRTRRHTEAKESPGHQVPGPQGVDHVRGSPGVKVPQTPRYYLKVQIGPVAFRLRRYSAYTAMDLAVVFVGELRR